METRCRLCAECSTNQLPVLEDLEFCSKIFQLFQIKISIENNLPTSVCQICYDMVERTWEFNDRIQKAQSFLTELVNSINAILAPSEALPAQTVLETQTLNTQNQVVELTYISTKPMVKCNFNVSEAEAAESTLLTQTDPLPPQVLEPQNINAQNQMLNTKSIRKYDFSISETANESDVSEKSEHKRKPLRTKSKIRKCSKRKPTKLIESIDLRDTEFDLNEDGSIIPKSELYGWDTYPWTCCDCEVTFSLPDDLKEHYTSSHNSASRYLCADCPKVYSKYITFLAHVKVHRIKLRFCCDICYRWFPTVAAQEQHRSHHGDDRPHACNTCGKRFRMQSALMVHSRSHLPAELKNRYQCDQCPKKFGTKPNLMAHKRIHTGIRDYTCDQCGKSFVQKGNLDNHLLTHTAVRPFNCNVCGKAFKTLVRLRKHGSVHSGLKPHQCDVCGRQFRERGTLKEHHRIHTGAMPFTCEFCGKCFRFKGVLTTHRRQHTGERPYSCNECQHHFTNWPNYNKHMKRRHGINTSVTCRTRQDIPPTGMPHRNPPGTVLAPPQPVVIPENFVEPPPTFYPVLSLYNIPEELLQQRV